MRTEDLIATLAAAPAPPRGPSLRAAAALGLAAGLPVTLAAFLWLLGPRPGLGVALAEPVTAAKTVLPLLLGALALAAALPLARPAGRAGVAARALLLVPLVAQGLLLWAFSTIHPEARLAVFLGHSIPVCLPSILGLSLPLLAGLLAGLRRGAPEHPGRLGALAGLVAAGIATAVYSTFCTEDSPLFYVTWYGIGILAVAALGAALGRHLLRW